MIVKIVNDGQRIAKTNYFDSKHAREGLFFLSWNAGAARLLVPDALSDQVGEMVSAKYVIVSKGIRSDIGVEAIEILFDDESSNPYVINIDTKQTDRSIPDADQGGGFVFIVWTRKGEFLRRPGKYRMVDKLPCLAPWVSH